MVSIFSNPLATPSQLSPSPSQLSGIPEDLEQKLRLATSRLIQAAGILMELPQPTIATAVILLQRFHLITSILSHPLLPTSLASLYLACKLTEHAQKPRDLINVFKYLLSTSSPLHKPSNLSSDPRKDGYYVPESTYVTLRTQLLAQETVILRTLGFQTTVHLPYTLAFNYLQSLGILSHASPPTPTTPESSSFNPLQHEKLISTTFAYLTDLLFSPSLPYLTHHPHEIAVAGIYLAVRDHGVKLPERWWEVWDVEREVLGFLVVVGRAGTYCFRKVYICEDGDMEEVEDGEVVAIGKEAVEREVMRRRRAELGM